MKSISILFLILLLYISYETVMGAKKATAKPTSHAKTNKPQAQTKKPEGKKTTKPSAKKNKPKEEKKKAVLKDCQEKDMKYVYTPCDRNGDRWRVQVPKSANCKVKSSKAPVKGIPCSASCKPGQFLDMAQQKCTSCKAGEFSVGDGKLFSNFENLPEGFASKGFENSNEDLTHKKENACAGATWKPKNGYLESNGSSCRSLLMYTVQLDRAGNVTFSVRSGDESSMFHVWVENELSCRNNGYDEESSPVSDKLNKYFSVTNEWNDYSMELSPGPNRVFFLAANFENQYPYVNDGAKSPDSFDSNGERSTMIKDIVVRGFSSSYNCEKCPPGTYSPPGSSECIPCPENTFSNKEGSTSCTSCGSTEYSFTSATSCTKRALCTENDYFMVWEPCKNGKTRKNFLWKQPKICSSAGKNAVHLPKPSALLPCPSCNPGQYNNGTACVFCPKNHYGDGIKACKKCPPQTRDAPGLFYKYWTQYPGEPLHLYCIARPSSGCSTTKGWMVHGDYMSTGSGHSDDAELLLVVTVPEFTKQDNQFSIDFSIDCPRSACRFKIEMMESDSSLHTIRTYEGNQERTTFTHERHSSNAVRYRLVFEKKYVPDKQTFKHTTSRMKIYGLSITNAKIGGTERCEKCETAGGKNCVKCKPGQYIGSSSCIPCPANTYLENNDDALGVKSCKKCPAGTVSAPGSTLCHSNCLIEGQGGRKYNFTALSGLHLVTGQKRFTTKGYMYYHQFKMSFCGDKLIESKCEDNATSVGGKGAVGAICRSTIIPDQDTVVSAQSIVVGKVLERIDAVTVKGKEDNSSTIKRSQTEDINLTFHSNRVTEVCKDGTFGIIRLVCDPYQLGRGKVTIGDGKKCNSETCDGCTYAFTLSSQHACPACGPEDYEVINTACTEGVKRTHYVWKQPKVCVDTTDIKPVDTVGQCTIFEKSILDFKVIILGFLLGAIVLALIVLYLCYRNRKLTYNYHRLVDATHAKDGELPAAEMCALEDGEEEEEIIVTKNSNGTKLMSKLRGMTKKKNNDFSEFENINLAAQYSDDDDDEI